MLIFSQCHHHQNQPLWQSIRNDDTTSSQRWRRSCTGVSLARATTKPESWFVQSPEVKNMPQSTKKACHHDLSPTVSSRSAPTRHMRAKAADQGHPSLPQDTPDTPSTSNHVGGVHWCSQRPARHHREVDNFSIVVTPPQLYQPLPIKGSSREQQGHHNTSSSTCPTFSW